MSIIRARPKDLKLGTKFYILSEKESKKKKLGKPPFKVEKKTERWSEERYNDFKEYLKKGCTKGIKTIYGQKYIYIELSN